MLLHPGSGWGQSGEVAERLGLVGQMPWLQWTAAPDHEVNWKQERAR
ncbi:hypothetical protein EDD99_6525 [Streptomyces sp. 846.5]|nr:hypothetical protein EDD99_6525 [Streptomyces sp. 846.5]